MKLIGAMIVSIALVLPLQNAIASQTWLECTGMIDSDSVTWDYVFDEGRGTFQEYGRAKELVPWGHVSITNSKISARNGSEWISIDRTTGFFIDEAPGSGGFSESGTCKPIAPQPLAKPIF